MSESATAFAETVAVLKSDAELTAIVADRVFALHVPPNTAFPLVIVEAFVPGNGGSFGLRGMIGTLQVRSSSQNRGASELSRMADRARLALHGHRVALVAPLRSIEWWLDPGSASYSDELAGVPTYHLPLIFRVCVR